MRQVDERLDRTAPELSPQLLVFLAHLVLRRMRRQMHTDAPEVLESHVDTSVTSIECRVQSQAQARDSGGIDEASGGRRSHRKPFFRCRQIAGEELAVGTR